MTTTKLVENVEVALEETKPIPEEEPPVINEIIPEEIIEKPLTNDTSASSVIVTNDTVIADEHIKETTVSLNFFYSDSVCLKRQKNNQRFWEIKFPKHEEA